ADSPSPETI
nr:immunoglobulin heavy chain junction region [Homo sapiens]